MNTYNDDAPLEEKTYEELRLIRCALERILQARYPQYFVDYQMEKFGKDYTMGDNNNREGEVDDR